MGTFATTAGSELLEDTGTTRRWDGACTMGCGRDSGYFSLLTSAPHSPVAHRAKQRQIMHPCPPVRKRSTPLEPGLTGVFVQVHVFACEDVRPARSLSSGIRHPASSIQHPASSIQHLARVREPSGFWTQSSGRVVSTTPQPTRPAVGAGDGRCTSSAWGTASRHGSARLAAEFCNDSRLQTPATAD